MEESHLADADLGESNSQLNTGKSSNIFKLQESYCITYIAS